MKQEHLDLLAEVFNTSDNTELAKYVNTVMRMRDFTCQRNRLSKFEFGDLVINVRNNELGFVVGPFEFSPTEPSTRWINDNKMKESDKMLYQIIVLTQDFNLNGDNEEGNKWQFRCRYVTGKLLKPIELEQSASEIRQNDLKTHCESQCFMECGPACSLYKYLKQKN